MKFLLTILSLICASIVHAGPMLKSYPYDAQAITNAYYARIAAASGTIQTNDLNAIGTFVRHAIANGYWGYLWDCSPLAGDNTNAAVQKLKIAPGSYSSLAIKSFTGADYSRTGSFFGKSGAWLDTGLRQIDLPFTNRSGAGLWFIDTMTNLIDASAVEFALGLSTAITPNFCIGTSMTATREQSVITDYTTINATLGGGIRWSQGLNYFSRTSPTRADWWINGESAGFSTTAQNNITPKTNQFYVYAGNAGVSIQKKMIGWYDINLGIPSTIQSNYYAGVRELMRGIGRIPQPAWSQRAFLVVGQSLAVGSGTGVTVYDNSKKGTTRALGLGTPLIAYAGLDYFRKGRTRLAEQTVETGWRAFADHLIALCDAEGYGTTNDCLLYNWGRGGAGYTLLKKSSTSTSTIGSVTTNTYGFSMNDIVKQQAFQQELVGNSLLFPAILSVHGETDTAATNYDAMMTEWKTDYETDIKSVTGQSGSIPIFHSQTITYGPVSGSDKPYSNLLMLSLHENSGGSNVLVGPKYMLASSDGTHLTNSSYRIMGEYYAESVFHQVIKGDGWDCLRPTNVVRTNAEITVTFNKSNLVLDTNWVTDPGSYGFTYFDDTSPPAISTVALSGATTNQAVITLAGTPTGGGKVIRYALNATAWFNGGPQTGPRGCLRDQSTQVGTSSGTNLWNYCVVFEKAVP